jgi:hypothetical protein
MCGVNAGSTGAESRVLAVLIDAEIGTAKGLVNRVFIADDIAVDNICRPPIAKVNVYVHDICVRHI